MSGNQDLTLSRYYPSVYKILTGEGVGSGFSLINHPQYVITNYHVVSYFDEVSIENQERTRVKASVVYIHPDMDLALLKVEEDISSTLEFDAAGIVKKGQQLHVLGYPLGMPFSVSKGVVSAEDQLVGNQKYIQTDAAINPGNSGGPVLDQAGKVVGISTCKYSDAENIGFALPFSKAMQAVEDFFKNEESLKDKYTVVCPSCSAYITEKVENCDSCGTDVEAIFEKPELNELSVFVEDSLKQGGIDPVNARAGNSYWEFYAGSATVRIFLSGDCLMATSPLVSLPKQNLGDFFKYLLGFEDEPYFVGVYDNVVYLSYRVHLSDVYVGSDQDQLKAHLSKISSLADDLDNHMIDTYGCTPAPETLENKL